MKVKDITGITGLHYFLYFLLCTMFFCNAVCHFSECDNCAQTLLSDLEKLDVELRRIKNQMDLDSLTPSSKEHLRKLEEAIAATTVFPWFILFFIPQCSVL